MCIQILSRNLICAFSIRYLNSCKGGYFRQWYVKVLAECKMTVWYVWSEIELNWIFTVKYFRQPRCSYQSWFLDFHIIQFSAIQKCPWAFRVVNKACKLFFIPNESNNTYRLFWSLIHQFQDNEVGEKGNEIPKITRLNISNRYTFKMS